MRQQLAQRQRDKFVPLPLGLPGGSLTDPEEDERERAEPLRRISDVSGEMPYLG